MGPYAMRRKNAMSSFMKQLNQAFPVKPSAGYAAPADPVSITGLGDYSFAGRPSTGARIGAWAGDKLGSLIKSITGFGDYSVASNTLMEGNDPPTVNNSGKRAVTIRHREYIKDIITSSSIGGFKSESFFINPGNPVTFPWLSQIASAFQEYRLDGMLFEFKTMSADALNSTNTALGQVIFATNYNPDQLPFHNKYEMENCEFSSSCKPSVSMMHPIECARHESVLNQLFVAPSGVIPPGATQAFYDFARTQIATNGFQAAGINIGELWITYEITFFKPLVNPDSIPDNLYYGRKYHAPRSIASFDGPFYNTDLSTGGGPISMAFVGQHGSLIGQYGNNAAEFVGLDIMMTFIWQRPTTGVPSTPSISGINGATKGSPVVTNAVLKPRIGTGGAWAPGLPIQNAYGDAQITTFIINVGEGARTAPVLFDFSNIGTPADQKMWLPTSDTLGPQIDVYANVLAPGEY